VRKPVEFADFPPEIDPGFGPFRAIVKHIVDGDTCDLLVDTSFNSYRYLTIRIMGIDAPELYRGTEEERERGKAAKEYLESIAPVGTQCVIRTDKDRTSFGRYSASILLAAGTDVGSEMVRAGHAVWSEW
jgi:endonuclease YncB( thermonuclease family)